MQIEGQANVGHLSRSPFRDLSAWNLAWVQPFFEFCTWDMIKVKVFVFYFIF